MAAFEGIFTLKVNETKGEKKIKHSFSKETDQILNER